MGFHPRTEAAVFPLMALKIGPPAARMNRSMPQAQFVALLALMLAVPPALYWLALRDERRRHAKQAAPPTA